MSYEWFAGKFPLRCCMGYDEGSAYERVTPVAATTVGPVYSVIGKGFGFTNAVSALSYGNNFNITDTTAPLTMVLRWSNKGFYSSSAAMLVSKGTYTAAGWSIRRGGTYANPWLLWQLKDTVSATNLSFYFGFQTERDNIAIVTYDGSLAYAGTTAYLNGLAVATTMNANGLLAGTAANASNMMIGGGISAATQGANLVYDFAWIDRVVTPAEAAEIYAHLQNTSAASRKNNRKFSLPFPKLTPAEYAAKSIIYDTDMQRVNGKIQDLTGGPRVGTMTRVLDPIDGPFGSGLEPFGGTVTLPSDSTMFRTNNWSIEAWVRQRATAGSTLKILQCTSPDYLGHTTTNRWIVGTANAAAVAVAINSPNNAAITNKWTHLVGQRELVGADLILRLYVDGVLSSTNTFVGAGVQIPVATTPVFNGSSSALCACGRWLFHTRAITEAEARASYLQGAKKILLDARLNRDGSVPVSPSAIAAAQQMIPGTPWRNPRTLASSVKIQEDPPVGTRLGRRWLVSTGAPFYAYAEDPSAFGSWYMRAKRAVGIAGCNLGIRDSVVGTASITGMNGYLFSMDNNRVYFYRVTAGAASAQFYTNLAYTNPLVEYEFWITRSYDSRWTFWIRGGAYPSWTLISGAFGTNPLTEATFTASKYLYLATQVAGDSFGDVFHCLGAMTPAEATAAGLLAP